MIGKAVKTPSGVIMPISSSAGSLNHRFPSGPETIISAELNIGFVGEYSVIVPVMLIFPTVLSVNQRLPPGPDVMSKTKLSRGSGNSVRTDVESRQRSSRVSNPGRNPALGWVLFAWRVRPADLENARAARIWTDANMNHHLSLLPAP